MVKANLLVSKKCEQGVVKQGRKVVSYFEEVFGLKIPQVAETLVANAGPETVSKTEWGRHKVQLGVVEEKTPGSIIVSFFRDSDAPLIVSELAALGTGAECRETLSELSATLPEIHCVRERIVIKDSDEYIIPQAGDRHSGRPPLGFDVIDGRLVPGDDYHRVCNLLQKVEDDRLSKRWAADKLGCVRKTIANALDRPEMYDLDTSEDTSKN